MDPYLRFLAAFIVLSFFPVVVDLATGGWKVVPQILRLDGSSRMQTERLQRSHVVRQFLLVSASTQGTGQATAPCTAAQCYLLLHVLRLGLIAASF